MSREYKLETVLIEKFCGALSLESGLSRNTILAYRADIIDFNFWLKEKNVVISEVCESLINDYFVYVKKSLKTLISSHNTHAKSLTEVQNKNLDVEIGSYPFFHAGKLGVSIVIRSEDQNKIDNCNSQILKFVNEKKIEVVNR